MVTEPQQPAPPKYQFVKGSGDGEHQVRLHKASKQGYKAILMVADESLRGSNQQILVLMEKQD